MSKKIRFRALPAWRGYIQRRISMSTNGKNQSSKENIAKLVEYVNSKSNPPEFVATMLSLCEPRRKYFPDRDKESQVSV